MTQTTSPMLELPPPPRPMTRRARRRAWGEGHVRFWWASAIVVLLIVVYILIFHIKDEMKHRRLLRDGIEVEATAIRVQGVTAAQNANFGVQRDQTIPVDFRAKLPDGREIEFGGYLPPAEKWIKVNQQIKLRIDPSDPNNFTEAGAPASWVQITGMSLFILLPIAAVLLIAAWWRARMMLKVWRHGAPVEGRVVEVRQSPAAPRSRVVHYSLAGSRDRRVYKMLYPIRAGMPEKGQTIRLLALPSRLQDAIAAELYSE